MSFQSTPPVRGATTRRMVMLQLSQAISIHAPRAGGDIIITTYSHADLIFQSTPPVRGATFAGPQCGCSLPISIHAPRAGGDKMDKEEADGTEHFNPRPPCGGRPHVCCSPHSQR